MGSFRGTRRNPSFTTAQRDIGSALSLARAVRGLKAEMRTEVWESPTFRVDAEGTRGEEEISVEPQTEK